MKKNKIKVKKPWVFVPMSADILHKGHINILKKAKRFGNVIVGLMTDRGIKSYKKKTPIFRYKDRALIVSSLVYVDQVVPLEGLKYPEIQSYFKFDYFIHGDDWKRGPQNISRKNLLDVAKKTNCKVVDIPYTKGVSSSQIKNRLKK